MRSQLLSPRFVQDEIIQQSFQGRKILFADHVFQFCIIAGCTLCDVLKCAAPRAGQRQGFKAAILFNCLTLYKPLLFKSGYRATDFCFVYHGLVTYLLGGHLAIPAKVKQDPPFGAEHAVFGLIGFLKSATGRICRLVQQVGREICKFEVAESGHSAELIIVSYKSNHYLLC